MLHFTEYLKEDFEISGEDTESSPETIEQINQNLDLICSQLYITPQIALERVRNILSVYDIIIPVVFMDQEDGEEIFQVEDENLFVYFGYTLTDNMMYEIHTEVMDSDELEEFMSDDEDPEDLTEDFRRASIEFSKKASRQAKSMGLHYFGFGRYGPPGSHKITHVVVKGFLVPVIDKTLVQKMKAHEKAHKYYEEALKYHIQNHGEVPEKYYDKDERKHIISNLEHNKIGFDKTKAEYDEAARKHAEEMKSAAPLVKKLTPEEINAEADKKIEQVLDYSKKKSRAIEEKFDRYYDFSKFTDEEHNAINQYTGSESTDLIMHAVHKRETPEKLQNPHNPTGDYYERADHERFENRKKYKEKTMTHLDDAIDAYPIPEDVTLYSGLKHPFTDAKNFKKGETVYFPGYLSTSLDYSVATNFAHARKDLLPDLPRDAQLIIQIRAKKGQTGLYVGRHSQHDSEKEMILPRDTVFKVVSEPTVITRVDDMDKRIVYDVIVVNLEIEEQP